MSAGNPKSLADFLGDLHVLMRRHGVKSIEGSGSGAPAIRVTERAIDLHHLNFLYEPGAVVEEAGRTPLAEGALVPIDVSFSRNRNSGR